MHQVIERPQLASGHYREQDEQAVRDLPHRLAQAWDSGDADAYAAIFSPDADYVLFDGSRSHGRAEIADVHRPVFEQFMKGSRLVVESVSTRFLDHDVALIHSSGGVLQKRQRRLSKDYERKLQTSGTLLKLAMIRLMVRRLARSPG